MRGKDHNFMRNVSLIYRTETTGIGFVCYYWKTFLETHQILKSVNQYKGQGGEFFFFFKLYC